MKEFRVSLPNRPGELARVADFLARADVNIKAVAGMAEANKAVVTFVGHDVNAMREALQKGNFRYREVEILTVDLEDKAGELAAVAAKLGNAGVNIESIYVLGREGSKVQLALAVDNIQKAKKELES